MNIKRRHQRKEAVTLLDEEAMRRAIEPPPWCVMHRYPDGMYGWRYNPEMRKSIDEWVALSRSLVSSSASEVPHE